MTMSVGDNVAQEKMPEETRSVQNKRLLQTWYRRLLLALVILLLVPLLSCKKEEKKNATPPPLSFNAEALSIPDSEVRKLRGQVLYCPIYLNIPYLVKRNYELSAFLAIHNTDLNHPIRITKVVLFDTNGKAVKEFLSQDSVLHPLATKIYEVIEKEGNVTGANFLVEWTAEQPVNEPLIESIMSDLSGNKGLAFLSPGRVVRERR